MRQLHRGFENEDWRGRICSGSQFAPRKYISACKFKVKFSKDNWASKIGREGNSLAQWEMLEERGAETGEEQRRASSRVSAAPSSSSVQAVPLSATARTSSF